MEYERPINVVNFMCVAWFEITCKQKISHHINGIYIQVEDPVEWLINGVTEDTKDLVNQTYCTSPSDSQHIIRIPGPTTVLCSNAYDVPPFAEYCLLVDVDG